MFLVKLKILWPEAWQKAKNSEFDQQVEVVAAYGVGDFVPQQRSRNTEQVKLSILLGVKNLQNQREKLQGQIRGHRSTTSYKFIFIQFLYLDYRAIISIYGTITGMEKG